MSVDYGIAGKIAFVMGGTAGIGRGVTRQLAQSGCRIAVAGREQSRLDETVNEVIQNGGTAIGIKADLASDLSEFDRVLAEVESRLGAPEIAIFNPKPPRAGSFMELTEADYAKGYEGIVLAFLRMAHLLLPAMQKKRWGRFVTIGSGTSKQPQRGNQGYAYVLPNTVRLAASSVCKAMAFEVAPFGITVNTIGTGTIATEASASWIAERAVELDSTPQELRARSNLNVPMGRQGTVEEIASLAVYLCSVQAGYTTGETILCDGGIVNCIV
jgi:3-oxoacyl-[acyl-carrier protein] reductase